MRALMFGRWRPEALPKALLRVFRDLGIPMHVARDREGMVPVFEQPVRKR